MSVSPSAARLSATRSREASNQIAFGASVRMKCAGNGAGEGVSSQDCSAQVRQDGVVYTSYGYTDRHATEFGTADEADCHDVGPNAEGSVFSEDARQVTVWSFHGFAPARVLGVRFDKESFAVFVAESVPRGDIDAIVRDLGRSPR